MKWNGFASLSLSGGTPVFCQALQLIKRIDGCFEDLRSWDGFTALTSLGALRTAHVGTLGSSNMWTMNQTEYWRSAHTLSSQQQIYQLAVLRADSGKRSEAFHGHHPPQDGFEQRYQCHSGSALHNEPSVRGPDCRPVAGGSRQGNGSSSWLSELPTCASHLAHCAKKVPNLIKLWIIETRDLMLS